MRKYFLYFFEKATIYIYKFQREMDGLYTGSCLIRNYLQALRTLSHLVQLAAN